MSQSIKPWIGITALIAFLIVIAGWFAVIAPTRAATADTRANIESEQNRTVILTQALETLKAQYADLDASRAELDDLAVQVPSAAQTADFRRLLVERAQANAVTILSLTTGLPMAALAAVPTTPAQQPEGSDATTESASPSPSPAAQEPTAQAPATPTTAERRLVGIPVDMTVIGSYDSARAFIASLQATEGRLYLVSGLGLVSQIDAPGSGGRPDTSMGDVEVAIQGYLLVLTPAGANASEEGPAPTLPPLPSSERNPFAPVS